MRVRLLNKSKPNTATDRDEAARTRYSRYGGMRKKDTNGQFYWTCPSISTWRNRPLQGGKYPYVYVDGIYLRRNWGGEYENVSVLVAIAVNVDGYREVLGVAEGMKEDKPAGSASSNG